MNSRWINGKTLMLAVFLSGCSPTVTQHGHRITDEDFTRIQPGVTTQREILQLLGSPSARAPFDDGRWYYVTQRSERMSFYQSEVTQQDVVTVTFNADGTVGGVERHGLDMAQTVLPNGDKTRTLGKELSVIEQLLGNVGRFGDTVGSEQP